MGMGQVHRYICILRMHSRIDENIHFQAKSKGSQIENFGKLSSTSSTTATNLYGQLFFACTADSGTCDDLPRCISHHLRALWLRASSRVGVFLRVVTSVLDGDRVWLRVLGLRFRVHGLDFWRGGSSCSPSAFMFVHALLLCEDVHR